MPATVLPFPAFRGDRRHPHEPNRRVPVTSTAIVSVGYDAATQVLELEFVDGDVYQYVGVPEQTYLALMNAESIGTFVNTVLKPQFEGKLIATP